MSFWTRPLLPVRFSDLTRWVCFLVVASLLVATTYSFQLLQDQRRARSETDTIAHGHETLRNLVLADYKRLLGKIGEAERLGADVSSAKTKLAAVYQLIFKDQKYLEAGSMLAAQETELDTLMATQIAANAAAEAQKQLGTVTGTVREGTTALTGVKVTAKDSSTELATAVTGSDGHYSILVKAGKWSVVASKSSYSTYAKSNVIINAEQTTTLDISLSKTPPPTQNQSNNSSSGTLTNGESSYELKTVIGYSVHVATFNLASGQFKVITDTAADDDCADDCPVKSLSSYVGSSGGFAGMNGTYFCPADYSACVDQTNAFFWKVLNTRLGKMINAHNGLGENDPFIAFNSAGTARYFSSWSSYGGSGFAAIAGINCKPALISGGSNILNVGSLDEKQRTTKSNRGAIGLKGQVLYLVIAKSATVIDLAAIMDELGVDYAFNVDGGGSSAMIFNNSYKTGPGRSLPNAIVIARQ